MKSGQLWFDRENTPVLGRMAGAIQGFIAKYGYDHLPVECHVNPATLGNVPAGRTFFYMKFNPDNTISVYPIDEEFVGFDDDEEELIIEVKTGNSILQNHFWTGPTPEKIEGANLT